MKKIKDVLIERDGMTETEALNLIKECLNDLDERLLSDESTIADDICEEWFGLEPDYIFDLLSY